MADDPGGGASPSRHDPYAAFREPSFRRFALGMLLVQIGATAQSTAVMWELYLRTDAAMAIAMVGLVTALPLVIMTLPAGYLADVMDRRKLMLIGMTGTTLTSLALAYFSWTEGSIPWMYVLIFFDAASLQLTGPARTALVPQLVPVSKLENAMKWRTTLFQIAAVTGPAAGGLVMAWFLPATYLFSAATTALFMVIVLTIHVPPSVKAASGRMLASVAEGLQFLWRRPVLLGTISLDLFAVLLGGAVYVIPILVRDGWISLAGTGLSEEQATGWLRAAPAIGAFTTAMLVAHTPPIKKAGRTMLLAVAAFGVATIGFGLSRYFWLSMFMLALTGAFDMVSVVVRHTLVQLLTPNEMRGRVSSVNSVFIGSSNEVGGFRAGAMAAWIGPVGAVVVGGFCTVVVVALWAKMFPRLRGFGAIADAAAEHVAETISPEREPQSKSPQP